MLPFSQVALQFIVALWPTFLIIIFVCLIFSWIRLLIDKMSSL